MYVYILQSSYGMHGSYLNLGKEHLPGILQIIPHLDCKQQNLAVPYKQISSDREICKQIRKAKYKKKVDVSKNSGVGEEKRKVHTEESDGLSSVQQPMVVCKCDDHNRANDNLAVDHDWSILDSMHTCRSERTERKKHVVRTMHS